MKPGCLIKALIASTIFFAIVFYIVTTKMDDYFVKPIKKFSVNYIVKDLKNEWKYIKETPEKDSLFVQINNFTQNMTKMPTVHLNAVSEVVDSIKYYLSDSLVTPAELESIKAIIEKKLQNERSKKD